MIQQNNNPNEETKEIKGILFQSQFKFTKANIKEYYTGFLLKNPLFMLMISAMAALLIVGIVMAIMQNFIYIIVFGVCILMFGGLLLYNYYNNINAIYKHTMAQNNQIEMENTVTFYEDEIIFYNTISGNSANYSYDNLCRIINTKKIITLYTFEKESIIVEKGRMLVGNAEELSVFLKKHITKNILAKKAAKKK